MPSLPRDRVATALGLDRPSARIGRPRRHYAPDDRRLPSVSELWDARLHRKRSVEERVNETLEHLAADYPVSARLRYLLKQGPRTTRELADAIGEDIATVRHALRLQMQDAEPVGDHLHGGPTPGLWRLVDGRPRQEQRRGPRP